MPDYSNIDSVQAVPQTTDPRDLAFDRHFAIPYGLDDGCIMPAPVFSSIADFTYAAIAIGATQQILSATAGIIRCLKQLYISSTVAGLWLLEQTDGTPMVRFYTQVGIGTLIDFGLFGTANNVDSRGIRLVNNTGAIVTINGYFQYANITK